MINRFYLVIASILIIALIFNLVSLFKVEVDESITPENRVTHLVTGAEIYCDNSVGNNSNSCVGFYTRGWPVGYGEGLIIQSTDGDWVESFKIDFNQMFVNYLFWIIPSAAIASVLVLELSRGKNEDSRD